MAIYRTSKAALIDLDSIYEIESEAFGKIGYTKDRMKAWLQKSIKSPKVLMNVLEHKGDVVGYSLGYVNGRNQAEVIGIAILKKHQGKGLGMILTTHLCRQLDALKPDKIFLQVAMNNPAAFSIYAGIGFKYTKTINDYYGKNKHGFILERHNDRQPKSNKQ